MKLIVSRDGGVRFEVHAKPRARESRIAGVRGGALIVQLAAPPADGAANAELIRVLASALSLPKRDVRLKRGESGRLKLVEVHGLSTDEVRARLGCQEPST